MRIIEKKISDKISKIEIEGKNISIELLNLGATLKRILMNDREGKKENIVLTYLNDEDYIKNPSNFGASIGRVAGRIGNSKFKLGEKEYFLPKNNNGNCLHGGIEGFSKKNWKYELEENKDFCSVSFNYESKDLEEGFPGNLRVSIKYTLTKEDLLTIEYKGISDKDTLVNLTNHSYFNLAGNNKKSVLSHKLFIDSDNICELDEFLIPTGNFIKVNGTPFDFRISKEIGKDIYLDNKQLKIASGYDHPWILNKKKKWDVEIKEEESGRIMKISTNQKGVVCYSMNFPDEFLLDMGRKADKHDGICFETQGLPIGYNDCFIEEITLRASEEYNHKTIFKFEIQ